MAPRGCELHSGLQDKSWKKKLGKLEESKNDQINLSNLFHPNNTRVNESSSSLQYRQKTRSILNRVPFNINNTRSVDIANSINTTVTTINI